MLFTAKRILARLSDPKGIDSAAPSPAVCMRNNLRFDLRATERRQMPVGIGQRMTWRLGLCS
jgi:hypothetical protein